MEKPVGFTQSSTVWADKARQDHDPIEVADEAAQFHSPGDSNEPKYLLDSMHRKLKPRHIQLIGIGG